MRLLKPQLSNNVIDRRMIRDLSMGPAEERQRDSRLDDIEASSVAPTSWAPSPTNPVCLTVFDWPNRSFSRSTMSGRSPSSAPLEVSTANTYENDRHGPDDKEVGNKTKELLAP